MPKLQCGRERERPEVKVRYRYSADAPKGCRQVGIKWMDELYACEFSQRDYFSIVRPGVGE
jgi:hypothetical protein